MSWLDSIFTAANGNAVQLQSVAVAATPPTLNQVLAFNGTLWTPSTPAAGGSNATQLQGVALSATTPLVNQVIAYNGSSWVPTNPSGSNATQLQGFAIAVTTPTTGQFLGWNGTQWVSSPSGSTSLNGMNYPTSTGVTVGSIAYVSAANTAAYLAAGAVGTILQGNGVTAAPTWSTSLTVGSGNVSLAGVNCIAAGATFLTIGTLSYTSQIGFSVAATGTYQFTHNNLTSLTIARATNDVSFTVDAAATSVTYTQASTAGLAVGTTIRAQSGTGGTGVGGILRLGGGLGAGAGNAGTCQIDGLALTAGAIALTSTVHTLTPAESLFSAIRFTGTLTGDTAVSTQFGQGAPFYWVLNATSGAFALTFGGVTGTRVYLPPGTWTLVIGDDTGSFFTTNSRVFEIVLSNNTTAALGTSGGALCKLPPNAVLTVANVRTTTALVGGTTTISLGIAASGITILKALAPPAVAALPLGVNTGDLGTDMLSTSGFQAYYAAAATIYGTQVQSGAACTAGVIEIYLAGYVP